MPLRTLANPYAIVLLLLCSLFPLHAISQYSYRNFTTEEGLPSTEVFDIIQDKKGFMWAATNRGVCRYDGYNFQVFTTRDGLADNVVFKIFEDHKGRLWFTSISGNICYYEEGRFVHHPANKLLKQIIERHYINALHVDRDDNLWFSLEDEDIRFYKVSMSGAMVSFGNLGDEAHFEFDVSLRYLDDGAVLHGHTPYSTSAQLYSNLLKYKQQMVLKFCGDQSTHRRSNYLRLQDGSELVSFNSQMIRFKGDSILFADCDRPAFIADMMQDKDGHIWISTPKGVFLYKDGDLKKEGIHLLKDISIARVTQDREGGYWIASLLHGLYYIPSIKIWNITETSGIKDENIRAVASDGKKTWFGTYNGYVYFTSGEEEPKEFKRPFERYYIHDLFLDSAGTLWTSAWFYIRKDKIHFYCTDVFISLKAVTKGNDNTVVVGHNRGFVRIKDGKTIFHSHTDGFSKWVTSLCEDNSGNVWLGTSEGLYKYSNGKARYLGIVDPLYRKSISDVKERNGRVFIATTDYGLLVKDGNTLTRIGIPQGLSSDIIEKVLPENDTILWIGTYKGIEKILLYPGTPLHVKSIEKFTVNDGLASNEVNDMHISGNILWVATNRGLSCIDTRTVTPGKVFPPTFINAVKINDADTALLDSYNLNYNENNIRIDFLGICYQSRKGIIYKYRLEPDTAWQYTSIRTVQYGNLAPGDYTFHLSAMNNHGVWNPVPLKIQFHIKPHFTRTWWFLMLSICALTMLLSFGVQWYIRSQRRKSEIKKAIIISEQKALLAQMNPHFIFNAMNALLHFILEKEEKRAASYLTQFSGLLRRTLENSKSNLISLEEELNGIKLYLRMEKLRFGDKFSYEILVDEHIKPGEIYMPSMLVQPFIENAIWHGLLPKAEKGTLRVSFEPGDTDTMRCIIEDNGIGRARAAEINAGRKNHVSMAINNIKERLVLLSQLYKVDMSMEIVDLINKDNEACGTRVILVLPSSV